MRACRIGIGADRLRIIEVKEHGGMAFNGTQHVLEVSEYIGSDCLAFERPRGAPYERRLRTGHSKMVGPKSREPFQETAWHTQCLLEPDVCLGTIE